MNFTVLWLYMKVFSAKFGAWRSLVWQKRAIRNSFLWENHIVHQSTKVFSLESFPLYGTACMHCRIVRSVTCTYCGACVIAECMCTTSLYCMHSNIDPALVLFPPSNCTWILAGIEINSTHGKKLRKYGMQDKKQTRGKLHARSFVKWAAFYFKVLCQGRLFQTFSPIDRGFIYYEPFPCCSETHK